MGAGLMPQSAGSGTIMGPIVGAMQQRSMLAGMPVQMPRARMGVNMPSR